MRITKKSHIDHGLSLAQISYLTNRFAGAAGFFIEELELPVELGTVPCGLIGPITGFAPMREEDTFLGKRGTRTYDSRLTKKYDTFPTLVVTVIAGPDPDEGEPCILYTAFGGPKAHKEPGELQLQREAIEKARSTYLRDYVYTEAKGPADLTPEYVEMTKRRDAILADLEASRTFWSRHALVAEPATAE